MRHVIKRLITIISLLIMLMTFACKAGNPFIQTPISGAMVIDTKEQVIVFDKPFKPKKMINKICFGYSDTLVAKSISEPPKFSDGTSLKLTAIVVDQNSKEYTLSYIENSPQGNLCIRPENEDWFDVSKTNTTFIKLVVSSNRKINLSKIEWVSYDIWDI